MNIIITCIYNITYYTNYYTILSMHIRKFYFQYFDYEITNKIINNIRYNFNFSLSYLC